MRAARLARGLSVLMFGTGMFLSVPETSLGQNALILKGTAPDLELSPGGFSSWTELIPTTTDSPSLAKSNGNPYKEIGTWTSPVLSSFLPDDDNIYYFTYRPHIWLGLRNSDDEGTQFDLKAVVLLGGNSIYEGEVHCITGVTRNPAKAVEVAIPPFETRFPAPDPTNTPEKSASFFRQDHSSEEIELKLYARTGTDLEGPCKGHSNSRGVRVYYDAKTTPARMQLGACRVDSHPACLPPVRD